MNARTLCLALLAACLCVSSVAAQFLIDLPAGSWANDVTPDGKVVVGTWNYGDGFIWRWQEEPNPTIVPGGDIVAVSDDGSVVAGNWNDPGLGATVAAIWTAAGGWQSLGYIDVCGSYSTAYDISGDGTTVVGLAWKNCSGRGFRWTAATGMLELQNLVNGNNRCSAISGDGSALGGFAQGTFSRTPAYWDASTAGVVLDANFEGEVHGFNEDGSISVGTLYFGIGGYYDAFVRDAGTGVVTNLGSLHSNWGGNATDLSEDGSVIVGYDVNGLAREAWVWTSSDGIISLNDRLAAGGLTGIDPQFVCRAVSDDGKIIVGGGYDGVGGPFGFGGFIASLEDLPWTNLFQGLAGTGGLTPKLLGDGALTAGSPTLLAIEDARANSSAWVVLGFTELGAPFKSGVLVPFPDLYLGPFTTSAFGTLSLATAWPAGLPSGFETWWQEWIQDPVAPKGFSASNGVKSKTP